ncbi:MAG: hypothetical protein Q7S34_03395 [bacterium]|nr:hypothetical protein [bacterium]
MIKETDKVSDFPAQFNRLEGEVKSLTENTHGIKIATWVTAISTVILAIVGILAFLK